MAIGGAAGAESLIGEAAGAAWDTGTGRPTVYGPHWEGFGDRLAMSASENALSDSMCLASWPCRRWKTPKSLRFRNYEAHTASYTGISARDATLPDSVPLENPGDGAHN